MRAAIGALNRMRPSGWSGWDKRAAAGRAAVLPCAIRESMALAEVSMERRKGRLKAVCLQALPRQNREFHRRPAEWGGRQEAPGALGA